VDKTGVVLITVTTYNIISSSYIARVCVLNVSKLEYAEQCKKNNPLLLMTCSLIN